MAKNFSVLIVICAVFITTLMISAVDAFGNHQLDWIPTTTKPVCQGSIADCLADDEFDLDSEINRRILATNQYISYGALKKNNVPCSRRGASYYNCKPGAQANPYNRGCSKITQCRS
ncbi:Rapid ALkalinization Factor [Macleaya cordata]|uniref:Rapid ALkalinization Factor n=1 Tax=Macleaya cordata TaxID=56857 RepID=A0A200Q1F3_MACCD|nr:Rapid ALkalinization Factor [Macleaya cordata]